MDQPAVAVYIFHDFESLCRLLNELQSYKKCAKMVHLAKPLIQRQFLSNLTVEQQITLLKVPNKKQRYYRDVVFANKSIDDLSNFCYEQSHRREIHRQKILAKIQEDIASGESEKRFEKRMKQNVAKQDDLFGAMGEIHVDKDVVEHYSAKSSTFTPVHIVENHQQKKKNQRKKKKNNKTKKTTSWVDQ